MLIEPVEALFPEAAIRFEPVGDILQGGAIELAGAPLGVPAAGDQAGSLQHLEVFGNRRLTEAEWFHELVDGRLAQRQSSQDGAPGGVGEGGECGGQAVWIIGL